MSDPYAIVEAAFGTGAEVVTCTRLPGGASRETWSLDVVTGTGDRHDLILRLDSPGLPAAPGPAATTTAPAADGAAAGVGLWLGLGLAAEARLMRAAAEAGVPVPEIVACGPSYILMTRVAGETIPRKILRDDAFAAARPLLARQCGQALAAIHRMPLSVAPPGGPPGGPEDPLVRWRAVLDQLGEPHPVFELALRRLAADRPPARPPAVVHGDFRNGNLIVGPEGIRAVLDWELAHAGDPLEDLGWLCVKAWRFGSPLPVGGFGGYDELIRAYEEAGGRPVDRESLRWWETFGVLKWGVICVMQTMRHLRGGTRSVELAAIGRRVCETEWDLLGLLREK
ncbi:phosphotransferase family protein [Nonomuraea sp. NPDC049504]|uniref:phosphotransferase family protein n=1 Tax=Nonomuraea sp. NPDC049504 TaxID=3154729 RepID=UPI003420AED0